MQLGVVALTDSYDLAEERRSARIVGREFLCAKAINLAKMRVVVGFDFGNDGVAVAVARQQGIDVVLDDKSKRQTAAFLCFGDKQFFLETAGAASSMSDTKQIKRLIGLPFSDPQLQRDIKSQSLPFRVTEDPDGYPLINVEYQGEMRSFTPKQVLAMVLSDLKSIAEKKMNASVVDCCIGIPVYFTEPQKRAVIDAATSVGLLPLKLVHENLATALAYCIYTTDLPNDLRNVVFVDIGHASMQVCITGLKKGQLKILVHSFDSSLGGRDFDEVLFQHFAEKFKTEFKIDVYQNARACLKLRAACEKLKKVLSANPEAPLNIECLMDEKDVTGFIKRDEFEEISAPILDRVKKPLEKALSEAGLTVDDIYAVEVVGLASRVPAIMKILTEFFGKEPRRTMNASECVAKGCALECAFLNRTNKGQEFQVQSFTKVVDTLRRELNKVSDDTALLKGQQGKISQLTAEVKELSKNQAAQESQIGKLKEQIKEFKEEKKGLNTKLQLLQETIEHQVELEVQIAYCTNLAREAEALADEARANNEARTVERVFREDEELQKIVLVQELDGLRQTLSRTEQQASFRQDQLYRENTLLRNSCEAFESERLGFVAQTYQSTICPLVRQIDSMKETTARIEEAWAARLQEAEATAAAAEERERSVNERLSQALYRINVLQAQDILPEDDREAESRQEYLP